VSLVLAAVVLGGSALVAGLTTRWMASRKQTTPKPAPPELPAAPVPTALSKAGFDVDLGDVVDVAGKELWLESAWLLSEGGDPVVAIFAAREAVLIVLPPPKRSVYLLDAVELRLPDDPPASLESGSVRFERVRRIPVRILAIDASAPLPWDEALLSEYRGLAGDALWLLGRGASAKAWRGRVVDESEIERWGGGGATLR
jgi:hypothetical protein